MLLIYQQINIYILFNLLTNTKVNHFHMSNFSNLTNTSLHPSLSTSMSFSPKLLLYKNNFNTCKSLGSYSIPIPKTFIISLFSPKSLLFKYNSKCLSYLGSYFIP